VLLADEPKVRTLVQQILHALYKESNVKKTIPVVSGKAKVNKIKILVADKG